MEKIILIFFIFLLIREIFLLQAIVNSFNFFKTKYNNKLTRFDKVNFYFLLPMLREVENIEAAISHFNLIGAEHNSKVVVITTEREYLNSKKKNCIDTVSIAKKLAQKGLCIHIHYPKSDGLKADQLNYAIDFLAKEIDELEIRNTFTLIYDADSRPLKNSLDCFKDAIEHNPKANIFHQSSIFWVKNHKQFSFSEALTGAGALRANRFVFAHELRKLVDRYKQKVIARYEYTHVTGHGLCGRLDFFLENKFRSHTPIEDMEFSFRLCVQNETMIPVRSLDIAEVPVSPIEEFRQLSRWFYGPGRFYSYFKNYKHLSFKRAFLFSFSAALITIEWLSCAFVFPLIIFLLFYCNNFYLQVIIILYCIVVFGELVLVNNIINHFGKKFLIINILLYPLSCFIFGVAGVVGALRLFLNLLDSDKTEYS